MKSPTASSQKNIAKKLDVDVQEIQESDKFGEFAFPCFKKGKNPKDIASKLASELKIKYIKEIKPLGPYINFYIDWKRF